MTLSALVALYESYNQYNLAVTRIPTLMKF